MMENKPRDTGSGINTCNNCSDCGMWKHISGSGRMIVWGILCASLFAVGYIIGEAKGFYFDSWHQNYRMNRMHRHMMMQTQGGMMMNGQKMMMPMQNGMQGMMHNGEGAGMMNNSGEMMMVSGTKGY
jgi:hypothetical protein